MESREIFDCIERDQCRSTHLCRDMICGDVMSNAKDPGFERTSSIEPGKALPDRSVNFLLQIAGSVAVELYGQRKPRDCRRKFTAGFLV
jgi:hypothetical protein